MARRARTLRTPDPGEWRDTLLRGAASLADVAKAAQCCRACRLGFLANQTVFGASDSKRRPRLLLVGEQPGDREDLAGKPFVGPAGRVLDEGLEAAGIDRRTAYLTNVVKHFSFELRGKRRIHKKPKSDEIRACRPWLEAEIAAIQPALLVCLGAVAAQAIHGPSFRVTKSRGVVMPSPLAARVLATVHPSSILRATDDDARRAEMAMFIQDLKVAARFLEP